MRIILATIAFVLFISPSQGGDGDTIISIKSLTEWFINFIQGVYEFEINLNVIGKIVYTIYVLFLGVTISFVYLVIPQLFLSIPLLIPFFYYQHKFQEKLDTSISLGSWIKTFFLKRLLGLYELLGGLSLIFLCGITIYFELVFWAFISGLIVCSIIGIYVFLKMKKETGD